MSGLLFVLLVTNAVAEDPVVFRSDVSLVRVDTQVLDRDNRTIVGLGAEDFVLREQGVIREIRNFASEDMPLDMVLLLDVSGSMRAHIERLASASARALETLGREDRVAILVFDRSTRVRSRFDGNRANVQREIERVLYQETFDGGTDVTRAMVDAANFLSREARAEARRGIVILTDDQTERDRDEGRVHRALDGANAVLCALIAPSMMTGGGMPRRGGGGYDPWGGLGGVILGRRQPTIYQRPRTHSAGTPEIARQSGGDSVPVDHASALERTIARIRQRYALHYLLPEGAAPGESRNVEVDLSPAARRRYPNAEVHYKRQLSASVTAPPPVVSAPVPSETLPAPDAEKAPAPRRRRAVDEPTGPRGPSSPNATESGTWRRAEGSSTTTTTTPTTESRGGWRRARPDELPSNAPAEAPVEKQP